MDKDAMRTIMDKDKMIISFSKKKKHCFKKK